MIDPAQNRSREANLRDCSCDTFAQKIVPCYGFGFAAGCAAWAPARRKRLYSIWAMPSVWALSPNRTAEPARMAQPGLQ